MGTGTHDFRATPIGVAFGLVPLGRGEQPSAEHLLHQLTSLAVRLLPGCAGASVTVWDGGRLARLSVSHVDLAALRDLPRAASEDPERQVITRGRPVIIQDTLWPGRWQAFGASAAGFGIRSVVIEPVPAGAARAAFGFYATWPHAFDERELALIGRQAGAVLRDAERHEDLLSGMRELRASLQSRSVIDQATGILMAERSCSAEATFAELRRLSNQRNVKLTEVARQLISAREGSVA
jgi:hypothetical protein